ncbi:ATP-binding cassette domain-containing protein [Thomasclavelia spiroformis]|uniref:ATP-binding cassette domain-containing protein n=1 Tax=Thomasclavelia spiroformis TaxID=29348 RepID=UPI00241EDF9D|nr:ATP-binding cassette domain-containing protein [Thomasclavelia spiroformis]
MNENVVEINNLCKTYKDTKAVAHVNMTIKKGDIYGFIGRNGAGKSTTLKMIVGLIFPTSGQIKLFGESRNKFTDRRIGSLIENPGLYPNLSAYDNMELKAIALGLKDKEKIIELLNLVKLDYKSKKIVKKFSLGMKQRLAIALALLGNPDLLILDEPINGLDPEGIRQIREVIQYLNENKKMTIIISSHILGELSKIATRYGIIRDGQMIEEISAKELDQKCRDYLLLKVEQVEKAIPLLENDLGIYDYIIHENNEIRIYDNIESSKINLVLTKHNIKINQIYYQKQDLESYFLEKIGG